MFHGAKLSEEDLRQRGWLELIEAAGRYEAEKGAKFTTYAYRAVAEGIRREAIFQMDRSGVTGKNGAVLADRVSIDGEDSVIRKVLYMAYGIGCERCANAGKIARELGMRELEVKRALQSGKRKLEELADGRK